MMEDKSVYKSLPQLQKASFVLEGKKIKLLTVLDNVLAVAIKVVVSIKVMNAAIWIKTWIKRQ